MALATSEGTTGPEFISKAPTWSIIAAPSKH